MTDFDTKYLIATLLPFVAVIALMVIFFPWAEFIRDRKNTTLKKWLARFLFNLAWSIDYMEVSRIIENDCEYVSCDEAYEYVCANMGD